MQDLYKKDHLLHGPNIEQMLILRGLIKEQQKGQVASLIEQHAGGIYVDFEL